MNHPDTIALISSTGDMNNTLPPNTGLGDIFKVTFSLTNSFKNHVKRHASIFTSFKGEKYWYACQRNTLATARVQDVAEVLNPDHRASTNDDVNLFKEKYKFMHSVFDKMLQTGLRKKCAREHDNYYYDQSVHQKLNSFFTESTNSRVSASTALIYITSSKI